MRMLADPPVGGSSESVGSSYNPGTHMGRCAHLVSTVAMAALLVSPLAAQERAPKDRAADLDARLLKVLTELAALYDGKKDPEAAHFFAECALGFGSTDDAVKAIRKKWEDEVYYGRSRGGKILGKCSRVRHP